MTKSEHPKCRSAARLHSRHQKARVFTSGTYQPYCWTGVAGDAGCSAAVVPSVLQSSGMRNYLSNTFLQLRPVALLSVEAFQSELIPTVKLSSPRLTRGVNEERLCLRFEGQVPVLHHAQEHRGSDPLQRAPRSYSARELRNGAKSNFLPLKFQAPPRINSPQDFHFLTNFSISCAQH